MNLKEKLQHFFDNQRFIITKEYNTTADLYERIDNSFITRIYVNKTDRMITLQLIKNGENLKQIKYLRCDFETFEEVFNIVYSFIVKI